MGEWPKLYHVILNKQQKITKLSKPGDMVIEWSPPKLTKNREKNIPNTVFKTHLPAAPKIHPKNKCFLTLYNISFPQSNV